MANKYSANCNIKGTVDFLEKKEFKIKATNEDFEILEMTIKANGSRIKGKVMNTKNKPTLIDDLMKEFKRGSFVNVAGRLSDRPYKSKDGREVIDNTPTFYKVEQGSEDDKECCTFMVQGFVSKVRELDDDSYKVTFDLLNENADGVITLETITVDVDEDVMSEMVDEEFEEKCYVKVAGFLVNKFILDDFNQVIDSERGLKVAKMYSCVVADEVNEGEMELYTSAKKALKTGKKVTRKTAEEDADDEEEEKPKSKSKRRSTFDEDDE